MKHRERDAAVLIFAGAAVIGLGVFLPWIRDTLVNDPTMPSTESGLEYDKFAVFPQVDGRIVLAIAIALAMCAYFYFAGSRRDILGVGTLFLALAAAGAVAAECTWFSDPTRIYRLEFGFYVTGIGVAAALFGTLLMLTTLSWPAAPPHQADA